MNDLITSPLSDMDQGDTSELGCAPVLGIKISDYDCCSTEAWVLVGPSLGDADVLVVETVEARPDRPYDSSIRWVVDNDGEALTIDDAVALARLLVEDYGRPYCNCP
jgi:hypothetical protein